MTQNSTRKRLVSGDTPTGRLHLGHWVGSLENRVLLQDEYDCYFIIANMHAFTTRFESPDQIHESVVEILLDYLAVGIDPKRSTIFLQSDIAAIAELTFLFSMLVPYPRLMRNPTIKDEIRDKKLGENYSMGFLYYPIGQIADILAFQGELVPVGEDQIPHLEMTREVARRFNQIYCGVDPHSQDADYVKNGALFPIPIAKLSKSPRLVGTGGPDSNGRLLKMSKSLNNAIYLSDDVDTIKKKVQLMYTDPNRIRATDKGQIENNPLWIFHDLLNPDKAWVQAAKERYAAGTIGDVECKKNLIDVIDSIIKPMREKRAQYAQHLDHALVILREGTAAANAVSQQTLNQVKTLIKQRYD